MFSTFDRLASLIRSKGAVGAAQFAWYRAVDSYQLRRLGLEQAMHQTMVNLSGDQLGVSDTSHHAHDPSESFYVFRVAMRQFVRPGKADVFLDYGSGLGRVLLMAATYPFRRVIGVEQSELLNDTAEGTIASVRENLKCKDIVLMRADASEYELPADVSVLYFFNPFSGETLSKVCEQIKASLRRAPRAVKIVYYSPGHFERLIGQWDWLTKRGELSFPAISRYKIGFYETLL
jgi:SAM-dependent methyltransferase